MGGFLERQRKTTKTDSEVENFNNKKAQAQLASVVNWPDDLKKELAPSLHKHLQKNRRGRITSPPIL